MTTPYKAIQYIFETYKSSVEQLDDTLKGEQQYTKKRTLKAEKDYITTLNAIGPRLTKQFGQAGNMDTYAPLYLSMSRFTLQDLQALYKKWIVDDDTLEKYTNKFISLIKKEYPKNQFDFMNDKIYTDIIFQTFDDFTSFIACLYNGVKKILKQMPDDLMNWKPLISKLKNMLQA